MADESKSLLALDDETDEEPASTKLVAQKPGLSGTGATNVSSAGFSKRDLNRMYLEGRASTNLERQQESLAGLRGLVESASTGPLVEAQRQRREKYMSETQVPGIPLDIETGVSAGDRLRLAFRRQKENQFKFLQSKYGEDNVRTDANGELIVRVLDSDSGKPKDILVRPKDMSAKDFIDLAGAVPEVAGGILALRGGRMLPKIGAAKGLLGLQRDVAATALGAETVGAAKDIGASLVDRGTADIGTIAKERTAMAAGDVALGEFSLGAGRFFNFLKSPLHGSRTQVQFDALEAQKYFRQKYGVDVPLTVGESTGSPLFSRTEAFMEKLPGGGTPFKELKAESEESLRHLQDIMMGKTPPTDESVGKKLIDQLMSQIVPKEAAVSQAQKTLARVGTKSIENVISDLTVPERKLFQEQVGKDIRASVVSQRDAVKSESDALYEKVRSAPGGEGKVFAGKGLQERFRKILEALPSPQQTTTVASPIVGPTGKPILMTETGEQVMKEFVPPNVLARLNSVVGLKDAKFSLSDLQQMRREVYDDIAKGQGVPGLGTHYLNDIGKSITAAMDEGVSSLPSGELKSALAEANSHYKTKVIPFNRQGLTELFVGEDEPGHLADSEVVSRVFSGGKAARNFGLMKEVLGDSSEQFGNLKRAIADRLLEQSRASGSRLIDFAGFQSNLNNFRVAYPEIAEEIFGSKLNKLVRVAQAANITLRRNISDILPGRGPSVMGNVDSEELKNLLKQDNPTAKALFQLLRDESKRSDLYKNQIMASVRDGSLSTKGVNPGEFVNRFIDRSSPSDLAEVMNSIRGNKELVEDLRAKTVERIFRSAARSATPEDIGQLLSGDPTRIVSGTSVFKQIESPDYRAKIRAILGPDITKDLMQYIRLEAAGEQKERSFQAAGGLAAGMQIAELTRRGPFRYLYEATKDWIIAKLLTHESLRSWLSSVPASKDPGALSLILTSPVFLQSVAKEFPGHEGIILVNDIKRSVDKWMKNDAQQQRPSERPDDWKQFLEQGASPTTGLR